MVNAYAIYCLIANLLSCVPVDLGQMSASTCQSGIATAATTYVTAHPTYFLSRSLCMNTPVDINSIVPLYGPR